MSEYEAITPVGKPGKVQAVAIMTLIDGILNIIVAISWGLLIIGGIVGTLGLGFFLLFCCPIPIYAVVVGVMEIIYATQIMPEPPTTREFPQYLAIMQIVNILSGNILSIVTGILALVFAKDPEVIAYFESLPEPVETTGETF